MSGKTIVGSCPHCGSETGCGALDNKLAVTCETCGKPVFEKIRIQLRLLNCLFFLPIILAVIGMFLRLTKGLVYCIGMILCSIVLVLLILYVEKKICRFAIK